MAHRSNHTFHEKHRSKLQLFKAIDHRITIIVVGSAPPFLDQSMFHVWPSEFARNVANLLRDALVFIMVAFTSAQETNLSVAARKITAFSSLGFRELERRHLCCARNRMAPKQGVRKRPAAGSHETFCDLQPGLLLDDATALERRAKRAATEAASSYPTPNGFSISCVCIGQPLVDDKPSPYPEECEPNSGRWIIPKGQRPSQIRLAFKWEILEGPSASVIESATCVLHLNKAVQQGVPLPIGWGQKVADLLDGSAKTASMLRRPRLLLEFVAVRTENVSWPA